MRFTDNWLLIIYGAVCYGTGYWCAWFLGAEWYSPFIAASSFVLCGWLVSLSLRRWSTGRSTE